MLVLRSLCGLWPCDIICESTQQDQNAINILK